MGYTESEVDAIVSSKDSGPASNQASLRVIHPKIQLGRVSIWPIRVGQQDNAQGFLVVPASMSIDAMSTGAMSSSVLISSGSDICCNSCTSAPSVPNGSLLPSLPAYDTQKLCFATSFKSI
jgi:hypothetical protein